MNTFTRWADAVQVAHDFLRDNMQYGDDFEEECVALEELLEYLGIKEAKIKNK